MSLDYGASRIIDNGTTRTVTYTPVTHREQKRGACPECGRKNTRSRTFEATVSPFNKDPETGEPRTRLQVAGEVARSAAAWVPDFTCSAHYETEADIPMARPTDVAATAAITKNMATIGEFTATHGLTFYGGVTVEAGGVEVRACGARDLARWGRALAVGEPVKVWTWRDRPDTTRLTLAGVVGNIRILVRADYGRRLGASDPVDWSVERNGKRGLTGGITVEAVAALPEREVSRG